MRGTGSLIGLSGVPLLIALFAVLPLANTDRTTGAPTAGEGETLSATAGTRVTDANDFRVGRDLVTEVFGRSPLGDGSPVSQAIIALLPDPDESSLDWMYDAHLASIRGALERAGYLSDRFWIPDRADSVTVEAPGGDEGVRRVAAPDVVPGVMVFRGENGSSTRDLVVVYIVGEVATAGVYRPALRAALKEAAELTPASREVKILGPTFSGSAPSLRAVLASSHPGIHNYGSDGK